MSVRAVYVYVACSLLFARLRLNFNASWRPRSLGRDERSMSIGERGKVGGDDKNVLWFCLTAF